MPSQPSLPQLNMGKPAAQPPSDKTKKRRNQGQELPAASATTKPHPQTSRVPAEDTTASLQPQQPSTARPALVSSGHRRTASKDGGGAPAGNPPSTRVRVKKVVKPGMTIAEVMKKYADQLSSFEQSEILEYQQIYCVGRGAKKIKGIPHTANNAGYDDDRGDYRIVMGDHMEYRYEVQKTLGRGSFGQVVKAWDHKKDQPVALKIIRNKKRFHHQALVEVKILEHLMAQDKEHKSGIVRVYGYFYFRNHLCITFEPLYINLYEFLKNDNFKGVSLTLIRRFAIQLLNSLKFLARERIVHCDLKPENVLLKGPTKAAIKLIDFGSSCFKDERLYTYIQSRFYRSPEVILGMPYGIEIDMWSFGCILSELYTGYPLFPGENEVEQMQCMMEVLGLPPKDMIMAAPRKAHFFAGEDMQPKITANSRGKTRQPATSCDLIKATRCKDEKFLAFLAKCLHWDPKKRLSPGAAMEDPWIKQESTKLKKEPRELREPRERESKTARMEEVTPADLTKTTDSSAGKALFPPIKPAP